ncbi:MAG: hypothetical protein K6B28_12860 [Lachnospiraceae bacterium]|nr:hypothetical protein [Lachnospiraceae bacterium]
MTGLKADYIEMKQYMDSMDDVLIRLSEETELLKEGILRLDITWTGEANAGFMLNMLNDIDRIKGFIDNMVRARNLLREAVKRYQEEEETVRQMIKEVRI